MSIEADITGRTLEDEVARIYTLLGATCQTRVLIKGYEIDVVADFQMGPLKIQLLVECKQYSDPKKVSDSDMRDFVVKVLAARECGKADKGAFVTTTGFTKDALATADRHSVECHTLHALYNQLVDFTPYIAATTSEFEAASLAKWYIPQTGSELEDYEVLLTPDSDSEFLHKPLDEYLDSLFGENQKRIAVLGNFGTGKSSLSRKYHNTLLKRYLLAPPDVNDSQPRLPVLIELRDYRSGIDIHELIVSTLSRRYGIRITVPLCIELQRMGRFTFILDGLDEMATRVDRTVVNENLRELDRLLTDGDNQYIVTCRTHFFQERVADEFLDGYAVVYLVEWNLNDLQAYLKLRFPKRWNSYFDKIRSSRRLRDIARTPQFVEMLMEGITGPIADDEDFGSLELYGGYVTRWIERESRRRGAVMNASQRLRFATRLAEQLFVDNQPHIHFSDLYELAREFSGHTDVARLDYFDSDARTCAFITKDAGGNYGFRHRSFMEYFCARIAESELSNSSPSILSKRTLSAEIVGFIEECPLQQSDIERLHEWSVSSQSDSTEPETLARNAAAILAAKHIDLRPEAVKQLGIETGPWSDLQKSISNDDQVAFARAVESVLPELESYMKARYADVDDIEDAIQDALLTLWTRRDRRIPAAADFRAYFFTIVKHRMMDHARIRMRRGKRVEFEDPMLLTDVPDKTDTGVDPQEQLAALRDVLTEREWSILQLIIAGHTSQDIAERLGVTRSTVKSLVFRVRKKAAAHLQDTDMLT